MLSFLITAATVTTSTVAASFAEGVIISLSAYSIAKGLNSMKSNFSFKH